jgi:hypothetical protein
MAQRITAVFYRVSVVALVVVFLALVAGLIVPLCFKEHDKVLAAKLVYSLIGMLIGGLEIVLGILLSLIGLTADYDIDSSIGSARIKLASASPGLLLILCGNLLMGFSLMREFRYESVDEVRTRQPEAATQSDLPAVNPPNVPPMEPGSLE